jgi:hypothetical protein
MWPFDQSPDTATLVSKSIVYEGHPILLVTHDDHDHGWQFLDGCNPPSEFVHVCMSHPVNLDASVRGSCGSSTWLVRLAGQHQQSLVS